MRVQMGGGLLEIAPVGIVMEWWWWLCRDYRVVWHESVDFLIESNEHRSI